MPVAVRAVRQGSPSLRVANEINETFKFISAHIDQDGDLEVSYYVPHFFSDCPEHVPTHQILVDNGYDGHKPS